MARPNVLVNFPGGPTFNSSAYEFKNLGDLANFDWTAVGHGPPTGLTDTSGSAVTLGDGAGTSINDYVQGQQIGSNIKFDRTSKYYYWEWKAQLSSATLCNAVLGAMVTNTNILGSATADGIGLYTYGGSWYPFNVATGSFLPSTAPAIAALGAADVSAHTFALQIVTDSATVGAGQATYFKDGVQFGAPVTFAALGLTQQLLRTSLAMSNGSAVAQNMIVQGVFQSDQV